MRRLLALATVAFPISLIAFAHGCSSGEPPVEDLCGWLGDPGNCYRGFFDDIGARCGGGTTPGSALKGSFLSSDKLDQCIITEGEGGTIALDAAITPASFPLTALGFSRTLADGTSCGTFTIAGPNSFTIMVEPYPPDAGVPVTTSSTSGAGGGTGAGGGSGTGGSSTGGSGTGGGSGDDGVISGGTFSITPTDQRDTADTVCPGGETHHFNTLQAEKCPALATLMPRAEIESKAPTYDVKGFIRVRIYHPPTEGYPETGLTPAKDANGQTVPIQPSVVEYFDCEIPPVTKPCQNGIQDGAETGIDCGGPAGPAGADPGIFCPRCGGNQSCLTDNDCFGGAKCVIDAMTGTKACEDLCVNNALDTVVGETDVDCGGPTCSKRCETLQQCSASSDCESKNVCYNGSCSNICSNMMPDPVAGETAVDCGGSLCPNRCADSQACNEDADCVAKHFCVSGDTGKVCQNLCGNDTLDTSAGETDVDCGGDNCPQCGLGKACAKNSDCVLGAACVSGVCTQQ